MKSIQLSRKEERLYKIYGKIPPFLKAGIVYPFNFLRKNRLKFLKTPQMIIFYVTNRCNLKCKHCFYWKELNKGEELTLDQIKKIVKSLKNPLQLLSITGGEPFLREDLADICILFSKINKTKRIHISTNGTLTKKIYNDIKKILETCSCRITLGFSIDGFKNTHDKLRGLPAFDKAISTIKKLHNFNNYPNFAMSVVTTIMDKNMEELEKLQDYTAKELKVIQKYNLLRPSNKVFNIDTKLLNEFDSKENAFPSKEKLKPLLKFVKKSDSSISAKIEYLKIRFSLEILNGKKQVKCLAGINDAVIFPNGDISICEPVTAFANLKEFNFDFYKLWNSEKANEIRKKTRNCFCIQPCNLLNAMKYDTKTLLKL